MFGVAQQAHAMSRPSYGKQPVGMQQWSKSYNFFKWSLLKKVKRQIAETNMFNVLQMDRDTWAAKIQENYSFELNKLAQEQEEALRDKQRLAYVVSPKFSDADKAPHIPVVIHQAKEQHDIDIYWLDPKEREAAIQGCNSDKKMLGMFKECFHDRMNALATANIKAYKNIEDKMILVKTLEYKNEFISKYSQSCVNNKQKNRE